MLLLFILSIYTNIIFIKISNDFSTEQPLVIILLFIVEIIGFISIFRMELEYLTDKNSHIYICTISSIFSILIIIRIFAYKEIYNFIFNTKYIHMHYQNYNYLKHNLIIATLLHSSSYLFHFIIFGICIYKKLSLNTISN